MTIFDVIQDAVQAVSRVAALQRTPTLSPGSSPVSSVPPTPQQLSATPVRQTPATVANHRSVIFRLHGIRAMWTTATDVSVVCRQFINKSVCHTGGLCKSD